MFGNPGETKETMQKTLSFALNVKPTYAVFSPAFPYPGTQLINGPG